MGIKQTKIQDDENKIKSKTNSEGNWFFVTNHIDAFDNIDAAIILTEWNIYKEIDWNNIAKKMRRPGWVFDARSITEKETIKKSGLKLCRLGDGLVE